ncbi:CPBP family intramembrane glutamic endopeptidase [Oceanivirga salmonicida]|uniref:CPBP family intramembrane glutamic endopeptidase n=1 Tax=Oceanivirga salmonicida TaxID=1769291 RepID=UPI00083686B4|nr:CPBP family intramembrane glutamic endopeptidase [Oceanivirga salmonicida]
MLLFLVIIAVILLILEAKQLNISVMARMCLKKLSLKQWLIYIVIIVVGIGIIMLSTQFVEPFIKITGINIPDYMPFFLNPTINLATTDISVLSPGFPLKGQIILLPLIVVTLSLNILAEELYFRAWILPKITKYGNIGWIANGILFALYHTFQLWLLPTLITGSLVFAFIIYRSKSILPALVAHLIINFLFTILGITMLII